MYVYWDVAVMDKLTVSFVVYKMLNEHSKHLMIISGRVNIHLNSF